MKKILALALALVMVLGLAACGGNTSEGGAKVSVFWYDEADIYLSTVRSALNEELDALGVEYDNQFAANDQAKQLDQVKTAIAGGSTLLVVNLVTSGSVDAAEEILAAAGDIPVVFFNRAIGTDGSDVTVLDAHANACFIGTDAPEAGHMQGKMIGDYLVANYDAVDFNGDGVISYALMKGDEANIEAIYRTQYGVEDANIVLEAAGKPAIQYFDASAAENARYQVDLGGQWSAAAAKDYMDTNFVTYNESAGNMIELVICNNDGMAEGAISALNSAGYNTGKSGSVTIPVFGVDATSAAKELIKDKKMTGTIKQDGDAMAKAIEKAVENGLNSKALFDGMSNYTIDEGVAKLRIPYAVYLGE